MDFAQSFMMKKFVVLFVASFVMSCGSSYDQNLSVSGQAPQPMPTVTPSPSPSPYVPLNAEALRLFGRASSDILGRPTGADLEEAIRFTDLVAPLYDIAASAPGPLGGTVTVTPGTPKTVVFVGYKTTGGATVTGTVQVDSAAGLQTYQDLRFVDTTGKTVTVDGTIHIVSTVESATVFNLVVTSNLTLDFGNDSILTLIDHVSHKRVEGTAPENYVITFNDTAEVRIQQGDIDYRALQTMPEPFVSEPTGPASGVILLTGIAPSRESLRLEVVENQKFAVYLQMMPNTPFMLIATI